MFTAFVTIAVIAVGTHFLLRWLRSDMKGEGSPCGGCAKGCLNRAGGCVRGFSHMRDDDPPAERQPPPKENAP